MTKQENRWDPRTAARTGIAGLDSILKGGFPREEIHLVEGSAGTGKTTLGLQYLLAGGQDKETGLYVTMSQSAKTLEMIVRSHGWSFEQLRVHELSPGGLMQRIAARQTVLNTSDVELDELTRGLCEIVEQVDPQRLVFDSTNVIGLLAGSAARYRHEMMALRDFLTSRRCTTLFLGDSDEETGADAASNAPFQHLASSVIRLEQVAPPYGAIQRRLRVVKMRGVDFKSGLHDFRIRHGGLEVYPRLGPPPAEEYSDFRVIPSGIATLDALLGGGLEYGTTCLILGPPGAGKSSLAALHTRAAFSRDTSSAIFLFDERPETFKARAKGLKVDLTAAIERGKVRIDAIDPADLTPGEFSQRVCRSVLDDKVKLVVIDSLTGYLSAMRDKTLLLPQLHELITFLSRNGVLTLLLVAQPGFMSLGSGVSVDVSYLSDTIIVLRHFEADGQIRRCLSAVKKRQGEHQTTIRELTLNSNGISVGEEPLLTPGSLVINAHGGPAEQVD
ncbi:MAG TPA: ATPase domain-containing protein [Polyangiaceae bacterium]|nr:ATPase domain-containing protein [Polyangiaceae bacterium]